MKRFYFTFGSWEGYPYKSTYLIVEAESRQEATRLFREKYPDKSSNTVNCADIYSEKEWKEQVRSYYASIEPVEVIQSEMAKKWKRATVLVENMIKMALDEFCKDELLAGIGTTEKELAEIGVDLEGVFE